MLGEVFGLTVRSRHVGADIGAGLKSLVGGELKGMTKMARRRTRAGHRAARSSRPRRSVRTRSSRCGSTRPSSAGNATEICAYGTAVRARRI